MLREPGCDTIHSYACGAEGRRVAKTAGASQFEYLFDLGGRAVTELVAGTVTTNRSEGYAGGRHLVTQNFGTTYFIHTDWLGTERARSTLTITPVETCTSCPTATTSPAPAPMPVQLLRRFRGEFTNLM